MLQVEQLGAAFKQDQDTQTVLENVSFHLEPGQTLGLVGESGCGKSVTSLAIMGLLPQPAGQITQGRILFHGQDLTQLPRAKLRSLRGNRLSMIFQEPMTALNPVQRIGRQILEVFHLHRRELDRHQAEQAALELLARVGIPDPNKRFKEYPHQLSGGMRQRVMIALALACQPDLLIADEPTTALDVTIQAQILELMQELQQQTGMGILFITHDLGVVAQVCDAVAVMYAGKIVEQADVRALFKAPQHPYTQGLLGSIPRLTQASKTMLDSIDGVVPPPGQRPSGCAFHTRCKQAQTACEQQTPQLESTDQPAHQVSCLRWRELQ